MPLRNQRLRAALYGTITALSVITVVIIGIFIALIWYGIDDGYALSGTSEMLVNYLDVHNGAWPRGWDDLRPQFDINNAHVGGWTFSELQSRIGIDFAADPDELRRKSAESPQATFRVVWARWSLPSYIGSEPNQTLCDYFRQKQGLPTGPAR